MRPVDIISGSAFRMALVAGLLFSIILVIIGVTTYQVFRASLLEQIESELSDELSTIRQAHESGETDLSVNSLSPSEKRKILQDRTAGLFNEDGSRVAGNIELNPNTAFRERKMALIPDASGRLLFVYSEVVSSNRVVVGKDSHDFQKSLSILLNVLVVAGVIGLIGSLLVGWFFSRHSLRKLNHIVSTLELVSNGDTNARIDVGSGSSQIDRISQLINVSLDRLSLLMESMSNTTKAIAHDLRSPLNRAFILVQEAYDTNDRQLLQKAEKELFDLGSIFNTVLRISQLESSNDRSQFSSINLVPLIIDVIDVFEPQLDEKQQTVTAPKAPLSVFVDGDLQMLKQMMTNLLQNFNRHTHHGSHLKITVDRNDDGVWLHLADNGPGIPKEARGDVLKSFYRVDVSRSEEGSGLGLALVQAILIRHSAEIRLSDHAPGLCIDIRFPIN